MSPSDYADEQASELVMYCCDSRFGGPIERFVQDGLGIARCARLVVPGGPVALAGAAAPYYGEDDGAAAQFFFLIDALKLKRVHLIQHDRCAFYIQELGVSESKLRDQQIADLGRINSRIAEARPQLDIKNWVAEVRGDSVAFLEQPVDR